jgi:predicted TIM-barrel fold metal-dependent hydrolase
MTNGNFFFSAEPVEEALPFVLEHIGASLIIFASDYPHGGSCFAGDLLSRGDISTQQKIQILRDNGIRLLGKAIDNEAGIKRTAALS